MSSRLSFIKKHLVIEHLQKSDVDTGIFIVAIEKAELLNDDHSNKHISGSAILATSLKSAASKAKIALQSLEVIVMGSSLLATGQMPALTDNFSAHFGKTFGTYIMNNSSGLKPLFQSIKQIQFNKKSVVALGSLEKPKNPSQYETEQISFREVSNEIESNPLNKFSKNKPNQPNKLWKLTEKEKHQFIKNINENAKQASFGTPQEREMNFNFEEPSFQPENNGVVTRGGACSLILMSGERLTRDNITPLAKILAYAESPISPSDVFLSLFSSMMICLERARLTIEDIEYFQFREQYPIITLAISRMFKIEKKKINVHQQMLTIGGPSKVNGVNVVQNLISLMKQKGGRVGMAGICNESGMSTSIIIGNVGQQRGK